MRDLFNVGQSVAILGGAFDPVTNGHIRVAEFVLENCRWIDEVCLMPTSTSNVGKNMESSEHRLKMCELAVFGNDHISVSSYEIRNKLSGSTMELLDKLKDDHITNYYSLSFIIGLDNALTFDRWKNAETLKREMRFIVCPRTGYTLSDNNAWFTQDPHTYIDKDYKLPEVSSTAVRESLKAGNLHQLNRKISLWVAEYILENNLYINIK
jgi:nicotinate (nicotinamide) nucleotide adenylyltransferase